MTAVEQQMPAPGIDPRGLLFILFRHKWKIILCALVGLCAAAIYYATRQPVYESEAKLFVRYVIERSAVDSVESQEGGSGARQNDGIINSEVEILTSWDLAMETAEAIGVERLKPGPLKPTSKEDAARSITKGLVVTARLGSNVIFTSYRHTDPQIATDVLQELVSRYFAKHLEIHRSTDAFDFVSQQTEQIRARLRQTEEQLNLLKSKAGIVSLEESNTIITEQLAKSQSALLNAETERAEQIARVKEIEKWTSSEAANREAEFSQQAYQKRFPPSVDKPGMQTNNEQSHLLSLTGSSQPSSSDLQSYQALIERLAILRQSEFDLLSKYTAENEQVRVSREQIKTLDAQRLEFEMRFPTLGATASSKASQSQNAPPDLLAERSRLAAIEAKLDMLRSQARKAEEIFKHFSEFGMQIVQLQRRKEVEEANYKYFESSLEKARIDEALDPAKMPNISIVQKPSIATRVTGQARKIVIGLTAGGLMLGILLALLVDLVLDRSVKRPSELEAFLNIRLLRSIPCVTKLANSHTPSANRNRSSKETKKIITEHPDSASWDITLYIRPYCDAIRDRLVLQFELNRLTHKPKLVAVTGCDSGAGTSTVAAGLAASLSETGDGKVLLVDMNIQQAEVHPFFDGNSACPLTEAIEPGNQIASAAGNLYLATATPTRGRGTGIAARRFAELFPLLKASDFEYIIFDLPPISRNTTALSVAGYMDKVLFIVEAEETDRDTIRSNYGEFIEAGAKVSVIVNKTKSYGPKWLGA